MNAVASDPSQKVSFNLRAVVRMTGVNAHTLRAWEKRYGTPTPERTNGGHRRYSQHEVDVIHWLSTRQREGISIGRAVELWQLIEASGEDPLSARPVVVSDLAVTHEMETAIYEVCQRWIESCLKFDQEEANRILSQAFTMHSVPLVCIEVIQKGLHQIGQMWAKNEVSVQQEHFASVLAIRRLDALLALAPLPTRRGRILMACPTYEEHTLPQLLLSLLLTYQGWQVVYLGANVPTFRLGETMDVIEPDIVVLSAQHIKSAASLFEAASLISKKGIRVAYGGRIFTQRPSSRRYIHGFYLGNSITDAVQHLNKMLLSDIEVKKPPSVVEALQRASADYCKHNALIEWDVRWLLEIEGLPYEQLAATNQRISDAIVSALKLGDLALASAEISQGYELMQNYGITTSWQSRYFTAYYRAAYKHLHNDSNMILEWLDQLRLAMENTGSGAEFSMPSGK